METPIDRILESWATSWYMQFVVSLAATISLVISFVKPNTKHKRIIQLYLSGLLILFVGTDISIGFRLFPELKLNFLIELANNAFNLLEAYLFLYILSTFSEELRRINQMKALLYLQVLLTIIGFFVLVNSNTMSDTFRWNTFSTLIHFYIIVVPCIWHFYDIYNQNLPIVLKPVAITLTITGYSLISIAAFALIERSVASQVSAIHYLFLAILCLTLSVFETSDDRSSRTQVQV